MSQSSELKKSESQNGYLVALDQAVSELREAQDELARLSEKEKDVQNRISKLNDVIGHLLGLVPSEDAERYQNTIDQSWKSEPNDRREVGNLRNNVIKLFRKSEKKQWTPIEVQKELQKVDEDIQTKSVYNTLDYLYRRGELMRVGRGRYVLRDSGLGFVLSDDLDE